MRLLVFGGTVFLSRAVAEDAVARGHEVSCACRGISGSVPAGARHLVHDRDRDTPVALLESEHRFDAVIDLARKPSHVRSAVAALPDPHWVFVSTISVYAGPPADQADSAPSAEVVGAAGGTLDETARRPLLDAVADDLDPATSPTAYGAMKVACEDIVRAETTAPTIIRPGLIAGPGDPSGRFSYWPDRVAEGGLVLVPGEPADPAQVIDVRDLATWIVTCAEQHRAGTFDATAPTVRFADLLAEVAHGVGANLDPAWTDHEFLIDQGVAPWAGPDSVPMWLPMPDPAELTTIDVSKALAAGLRIRAIRDTARDTLAWLRSTPNAARTGISRDREAQLLAAWAARRSGAPSVQ
ncbi:MAG: NAD-dependent epimerase/dehydratase family protein [Nocardioides sp.]